MSGFGHGAERASKEVIGGLATSLIIITLASSGLITPSFVFLFNLLNLLGTIALIVAMPYWGTIYLAGWLVGLLILSYAGLVGIFDFIIYFGVPSVILILRMKS